MGKNPEDIRLVFMGTPAFAVPSLKRLVEDGYQIAGVVTVPDKPAGRGRKPKESDIKQFAISRELPLLQPWNLRDPEFIDQLQSCNPDIIIVVAFRMLPKDVWSIPPYGTINLHASLLPAYRGAAPINHAIIRGEKETGLTTFLIDDHLDTGNILKQRKVEIKPLETFGDLHDRMKDIGSELLAETVRQWIQGDIHPAPQLLPPDQKYLTAPKITKEDTIIDWTLPAKDQISFIHGLSPYPAASFHLSHPETGTTSMRVFKASLMASETSCKSPALITDGRHYIRIGLPDGTLELLDIQLKDRKRMKTADFLRGFRLENGWKLEL